jgi:hypothetical protein
MLAGIPPLSVRDGSLFKAGEEAPEASSVRDEGWINRMMENGGKIRQSGAHGGFGRERLKEPTREKEKVLLLRIFFFHRNPKEKNSKGDPFVFKFLRRGGSIINFCKKKFSQKPDFSKRVFFKKIILQENGFPKEVSFKS